MKLEDRLQTSIRLRAGNVILRREIAGLGSPSQISVALNALQKKGVIKRLGSGVYAKAVRDKVSGTVMIPLSLEALALEVFNKLGVSVRVVSASAPLSEHNTAPKLSVGGRHRLSRKLSLADQSICYVQNAPQHKARRRTVKADAARGVTPTTNVAAQHVLELARRHNVSYMETYRDRWAEAVTRLAGDEVRRDPVKDVLQALRRAGKITAKEMATLLIGYLREEKRVRSI